MSLGADVWNDLRERYGADLRVVIRYHPAEFETHMRDDIREQYTETELQSIVDDAIVDQLNLERTASSIKTGELHGVVRIFDSAWVLVWPDDLSAKSGFIVSLQRDRSSRGMDCIEEIDRFLTEERPSLGP